MLLSSGRGQTGLGVARVGGAARPCVVNGVHFDDCKRIHITVPCHQIHMFTDAYPHSALTSRSNHRQWSCATARIRTCQERKKYSFPNTELISSNVTQAVTGSIKNRDIVGLQAIEELTNQINI